MGGMDSSDTQRVHLEFVPHAEAGRPSIFPEFCENYSNTSTKTPSFGSEPRYSSNVEYLRLVPRWYEHYPRCRHFILLTFELLRRPHLFFFRPSADQSYMDFTLLRSTVYMIAFQMVVISGLLRLLAVRQCWNMHAVACG